MISFKFRGLNTNRPGPQQYFTVSYNVLLKVAAVSAALLLLTNSVTAIVLSSLDTGIKNSRLE